MHETKSGVPGVLVMAWLMLSLNFTKDSRSFVLEMQKRGFKSSVSLDIISTISQWVIMETCIKINLNDLYRKKWRRR